MHLSTSSLGTVVFRCFRHLAALALSGGILCAISVAQATEDDAFRYSRLLGKGINLGNALEAPQEGAWGVTLRPEYFSEIKKVGFDSVRIPINWAAHAAKLFPYTIDPAFFRRVDWAVDQALSNGLVIILDLHHYSGMFRAPDQNLPRLIGLWSQISEHYRHYPDTVYFELLNEPQSQLTDDKWEAVMMDVLNVVRASNPTRAVILGPAYWNGIDHLSALKLPDQDRNIIVTIHYYVPMRFTHQGVPFIAGSDKWQGTAWTGTAAERSIVNQDFSKAANWAFENRRPIFVGEFGSYQGADPESRVAWTRAVVDEAKKHGFTWAYWEFCSSFGLFSPVTMNWNTSLLQALVGTR